MTASNLIPRTCTEIATDNSARVELAGRQPLSAFREVPACVLLGEPGAGKTTEFEQECAASSDHAEMIRARRFAKADIASHPEWQDKVLFIDGLDETRAGGHEATEALDEIAARLEQLGRPRFRISCRAADWLGPVDRHPLATVSPDGRVSTLQLDPLGRSGVRQYLTDRLPETDPGAFILEAESRGLGQMLDNPLTLKLLIASTRSGWPSTRREAFERFCFRLAEELNPKHPRSAKVHPPELTLPGAGRLCAIQLLSGSDGYTFAPPAKNTGLICVTEVAADVAEVLARTDFDLRDIFATNLFVPVGEQSHVPKHRQIAEYLAGRHIADLIATGGTSVGRVRLALTSRVDDRIVTDLRGLAAWLGALSGEARREMIAADPVGMGLYGDISEWRVDDRRTLLEGLIAQARPEDLWGVRWFDRTEHRYRDATAWSFRGLCKPDMATTLEEYLGPAQRGNIPSHILELLLRSLTEIEDPWQEQLRSLVPIVGELAREVKTEPDVRRAALLALNRIDLSTSNTAATSHDARDTVRDLNLGGIITTTEDATMHDAHRTTHRPPSTLELTSEVAATLRDALDAVRDGRFADPSDEIAGTLLRLLYPQVITPDLIWEYASLIRRGSVGEGRSFWREVLCDETPADDLASLLDGFADDTERLWPIISSAFTEEVPWRLLVRALREIGHRTEPERLYHWIAAVRGQVRATNTDERAAFHEWLKLNDETTKQVLRIAIIRSTDNEAGMDARLLLRELLMVARPSRLIEWCVQRAREHIRTDWDVACAFLEVPRRYGHWFEETHESMIEQLRSALANDPRLLAHLDECPTPSAAQLEAREEDRRHQQELDEIRAEHEQKRQQRQADWRALLRESSDELATNSFPAPDLHTLALAYFGLLVQVSGLDHPRDRVAELIGDNAELLEVAMGALRHAPLRDDVPTAERTAELSVESKHDWLAYPLLAGLAIREAEGTLDLMCFPDGLRRSAIAIYATTLLGQQQRPTWPKRLLNDDPQLVLDVLHMCSVAAIKNGETHLWMLDWLNDVEGPDDERLDFRMQSPDTCLPVPASPSIDAELRDFRLQLLRSISVRLPVAQLPIVDRLLQLVSKHPDTAPLKELVVQKLRAASMTNAQRIRWMTLDTIMSGGEALELLDDFIGSNAKRARQLAEFLSLRVFVHPAKLVDRLIGDDPSDTFRGLVGIIGRHFPPREFKSGEVYSVGASEEMSDLVGQWIMDLGGQPTTEAGAALDGLIADERLGTWHSRLEYARNRQQRLHRDASYAPMNVADVLRLLRDGPPANVADLHTLLSDRLRDLRSHIRGGDSNLWRPFWADDRGSPPSEPKHENSCRDALLAMMRNRLPEGVDAQPEGLYAADRRADIRVAFKDFNIPVEIKRHYHRDLWTAIHDQLTAKYTTDPATGGHGIYLVIWFGSEVISCPPHPKSRDRPSTPAELERRLNEAMSHEERRTTSVVVLDVTKP